MPAPRFLAACLLALTTASLPAQAIVLSTVVDNGNTVDTTFTTATHVGVDANFVSPAPVSLSFVLEAADVDGAVSFNSILRELSGRGFGALSVRLTQGAAFDVGSVAAIDGSTPDVAPGPGGASVLIHPAAGIDEFYLGNPFDDGRIDWRIEFAGLAAGDTFTLTLAPVPEPGSPALLLLGGLALLAVVRRRA